MRYALAVEYDGTRFCGWQKQKHCVSVQSELECAVSQVANVSIELTCSGRTDAGVHAKAQVVHFDTLAVRPDKAWIMGVNNLLDRSISVHWVSIVSDEFHARYSAIDRCYRYEILNRTARPGLGYTQVAWVMQPLNEKLMNIAGQHLIGEFDFSAFRAAGCQAKHARREVKYLRVFRNNDRVIIEICANAFLHNMVRIIVGSLIKIGKGERSPSWMLTLLQGKNRTQSGATAEPGGLYFVGPRYPAPFCIPEFGSRNL